MLSYYCLTFRKNTESKNSKIPRPKNRRVMFYQNVIYVTVKKFRFIKEQEASGFLSSLGIKTPLSKTPFISRR